MTRVLISCPQMQHRAGDYADVLAAEGIEADLPPVVQQLTEDELLPIIGHYDGAIAGDDAFTARVIDRASQLRVISKWGVGIDNIDLEAARRRGILVTNTPGVFGDEVADVVVGYLVMLARGLHQIDRGVRDGEWPKIEGSSLAGKTLGVVGLGSIGMAVARRGAALGMRVMGNEVSETQAAAAVDASVELAQLDQLLATADYVSLNCPLTDENRHMLGEASLSLMKPRAYLINTARGPLVDEAALVAALERGMIAGAALDVFEEEPLPLSSPLHRLDQVILGSHNASNTEEAVTRVCDLAIANLIDGLSRSADG